MVLLLRCHFWWHLAILAAQCTLAVSVCDNSTFPYTRIDYQSIGLEDAKEGSSASPKACLSACCQATLLKCSVWQWNADYKGVAVCFVGKERMVKHQPGAGWVGGATTPVPPSPHPHPSPSPPSPPPSPPPSLTAHLPVDFAQVGPQVLGLGGCSGGGATSRTLYDYAEPYKTQVRDKLPPSTSFLVNSSQ